MPHLDSCLDTFGAVPILLACLRADLIVGHCDPCGVPLLMFAISLKGVALPVEAVPMRHTRDSYTESFTVDEVLPTSQTVWPPRAFLHTHFWVQKIQGWTHNPPLSNGCRIRPPAPTNTRGRLMSNIREDEEIRTGATTVVVFFARGK
ncbi:hypothetical protein BU24DRAFT_415403 [Aaosphaeria arxii CBS 175.79]|uniref:Uncharacterized protein n=1 Tax=Aaosphaeria arxii CBS 175.79 TaxID=1450172 RepID=A0A6A5X7X0_9PLEO|nr:uncharacterized protein BU24DRAFT_415403 [Aaosphaeria arxii CBS 175.79]KAF2009048.1 hypothetical protein BU24DRAFT_415403 [Aaosphaeria arxii CBS 175.79]